MSKRDNSARDAEIGEELKRQAQKIVDDHRKANEALSKAEADKIREVWRTDG